MRQAIWISAAAACAGIYFAAAGSSVSYLKDEEHVENHLICVGEDGIDGLLTEPSWDPDKAVKMLPNTEIPKDPQVSNTSAIDLSVMTALQVEFVYSSNCPDASKAGTVLSDEDMAAVYSVYTIDWDSDIATKGSWIRFNEESGQDAVQHFYYRYVLKRNYPEKGDTTVPLFTSLSIPASVNNERYAPIQKMGGFDIRISGMVLQQTSNESGPGITSAEDAYTRGLFTFSEYED